MEITEVLLQGKEVEVVQPVIERIVVLVADDTARRQDTMSRLPDEAMLRDEPMAFGLMAGEQGAMLDTIARALVTCQGSYKAVSC